MKKIAKIIPYHKMPRGIDFFDYEIPENLLKKINVGSQVLIPLKNKIGQGLVFELTNQSDFENLKQIISLDDQLPKISVKQMEFIKWFSRYYFYSLPSTIKLFLPEQIKRKAQIKKNSQLFTWNNKKIKVKDPIIKIAKQINNSKSKKFLALDYDYENKIILYQALMENCIKSDKQILIVVPTIEKINALVAHLPIKWKNQTIVLTKEITSSKSGYMEIWTKIKENKTKIIIGTRNAIYYPLDNLAWIIVDDIQSPDLKSWDQNPRFHAIDCVRKIQEITDCRILLTGYAPAIEDFYLAREQKYQLITLGNKKVGKQVKILNLRDARQDQFTYLSWPLLENIRERLMKKKSIALIVNKKGFASRLQCLDCQYTEQCPQCGLSLVVSGGKLKCFHCQTEKNILLTCPNCRGANLKPLGVGQEQIIESLKKEFLDHKISDDSNNQADIYVLVGQIPEQLWSKINYAGIVYADSLIYLPDPYSNEKLYQNLNAYIYQALKYRVYLEIQTAFPENIALQSLLLPYQDFFTSELKTRQVFNYPPFCEMVVLFNETRDQHHGIHDANNLYQRLLPLCREFAVEISMPNSYYRQHVRGKYRQIILLKFNRENPEIQAKILHLVPQTWTIDKRPQIVI